MLERKSFVEILPSRNLECLKSLQNIGVNIASLTSYYSISVKFRLKIRIYTFIQILSMLQGIEITRTINVGVRRRLCISFLQYQHSKSYSTAKMSSLLGPLPGEQRLQGV